VIGRDTISDILTTVQQSPAGLIHVIQHYAVKLVMTAGLAYLGLATADYLWQHWQFTKQLRMTKEEVKQEFKNSEGDPHLKQRMRSLGRARARRQMFRDVPNADVVIVNPTHRAIALRYDVLQAPAPIVLAMGQRKVAERIKAIALEHGVPVIENRPLAIALLSSARVGMMIPAELYLAVAEVLAFVIRQRQTRGSQWGGYRPVSHLVGDPV
jgi:flagellar biosynthetic protein FlhB